ncbi:Amidohydrolase_family protein [Hexamita inflata]|uniref:Amidohydrolase family protein n=1 Tax=Hexamita inflata TaxID=28002 RepID=A0AA86U4C5_9EUKA|nr:Amidohydrolase family protein [Hexamita inflata]
MKQLISVKFLATMQNEQDVVKDAYVLFDDKIIEYGKLTEEKAQQFQNDKSVSIVNKVIDGKIIQANSVAFPAFVKGHGHDETCLIGLRKEDILTEWLDNVVNPFSKFIKENHEQLKKKLHDDPFKVVFRKCRLDDIQFGITTYLAHQCNYNKYYIDELVEANDEAGTRAVIAVGSQDRNFHKEILDTVDQAILRLDTAYGKHKDNKMATIIPGPDQDFSNSPEMLKAQKQWSREHEPHLLHIHSSEEKIATDLFTQRYGMTPIEYFHSIGMLDGNTFVAHQVQSTANDIKILRETQTPIINNPLANTILQSGVLNYKEVIENKIPYAVSTDGSGSADNQNILAACQLAFNFIRQQKGCPNAFKMLQRVTTSPAAILKQNVGTIQVGRQADFILFDCSKPYQACLTEENLLQMLLQKFVGNEITDLLCNGQFLLKDGKYGPRVQFDADKVINQVQIITDDFMEWMKQAEIIRETGVGWTMNK